MITNEFSNPGPGIFTKKKKKQIHWILDPENPTNIASEYSNVNSLKN